jgi:hypothetical protein
MENKVKIPEFFLYFGFRIIRGSAFRFKGRTAVPGSLGKKWRKVLPTFALLKMALSAPFFV